MVVLAYDEGNMNSFQLRERERERQRRKKLVASIPLVGLA